MLPLLVLASASATTLTVGASGYPSIQAAIAAASDGDSVVVDPGVWTGTIDFGGKRLTLRSRDGAGATTLVGGAGAWTVLLQTGEPSGTVVDGFTLANPGGAGLYVGGGARPTLRNLAFEGNGAYGSWLPALHVSGADATLTDASFVGNGSQYGGAVLVESGTIGLERVTFADDAAWYGGALFVNSGGAARVTDCTFTGEEAAVGGGAVYVVSGASLEVSGSTFEGNQADTSHGGAIFADVGAVVTDTGGSYIGNLVLDYDTLGTVGGAVYGSTATLAFTGSTFDANTAYRGGGFYASGGTVALDGVTLTSNYATQGGAGWVSEGAALTDSGSSWSKNTSYDVGGALVGYNSFQASLTGSTFSENLATYSHAGAVYGGTYGTFACTGCTFTENTAYYYGGALFLSELYGTATVTDSTFDQNRGTYGYGGAIFAQYWSDLLISGSTFSSNVAYQGGGVYAYYRTDVTITDATFAGNTASIYAGGAIGVADAGLSDSALRVERVELTDNTAGNEGGALFVSGMSTVTVVDSHLLRNAAGPTSFGGGVFAEGNTTLEAVRNQLTANSAGYGGAAYVDTPTRSASWTNNRFTENVAGVGGAFCAVGGGGQSWLNNTFVGNGATEAGGTGCVYGTSLRFQNNVVAWTDPASAIHDYSADTAAKAEYGYNSWYGNVAGDASGEAGDVAAAHGSVTRDPGLVLYSRDGDDTNDNLRLLRDSPLLDAGDPDLSDPDGSRSDIGAYGGPAAPAGDTDGDGWDASSDCDDADATVHPGRGEVWYDGVNQDCAGASDFDQDGDGADASEYGGEDCDDTDPAASGPCGGADTGRPAKGDGGEGDGGGCGCAAGGAGAAGWYGVGMLAIALTIRRTHRPGAPAPR